MSESDIIADVIQPVIYHHPVTGGFHHSVAVLPISLKKRTERLPVVLYSPRVQYLPGRVLNYEVARFFVVVDPNAIIVGSSYALHFFHDIF
ncbi:hypothetical protein Q644_25825 [Brucella intermedia 229E]|uniref:Uncharacterized protein n=1 Tax=Brucella intermedia 229E TaxID=1337887 RepID=U4V7E0_9HYPH|nr:hypothetical protein Q644_25825 [Brucella intermedia 229E]OOC59722.1 hypothetical protein AS855_07955 [Brucella intermedia M86]